MILKGNQRAGGRQLAAHLMNVIDNDHVTVHELRGFIADNLHGAMNETYAISRGTKCRQFLFSLSLNPPQNETVDTDVFEDALERVEHKLGLTDQPRAIVFHEKNNRRHVHAVWSRINTDKMRAINLPHYKIKLQDMSRELYLEHGWQMPDGFKRANDPDPLNFSLEEWQQAKRAKRNPKEVKAAFQKCWNGSTDLKSFSTSLKRQGFLLAQGDRRGFVAVDQHLEVHSIARRIGIKNKGVNAKLGDSCNLLTVEETKNLIQNQSTNAEHIIRAEKERQHELQQNYERTRKAMIMRHRQERAELLKRQEERRIAENKIRAAKLPTGLKALWFRITGKYREIRISNAEELETQKILDLRELQILAKTQESMFQPLREKYLEKNFQNNQLKLKSFNT